MAINPHRKGGPDIPVLDGGTGASNAAAALSALGGIDNAAHALINHAGILGVPVIAHGMAYRTTAFTAASPNTFEALPFTGGNAELVNVSHSVGVNPTRVTVTVAGVYKITAVLGVRSGGGASLPASARLVVDGTTEIVGSYSELYLLAGGSSINDPFICEGLVTLGGGSYVELELSLETTHSVPANTNPDPPTTSTSAKIIITKVG